MTLTRDEIYAQLDTAYQKLGDAMAQREGGEIGAEIERLAEKVGGILDRMEEHAFTPSASDLVNPSEGLRLIVHSIDNPYAEQDVDAALGLLDKLYQAMSEAA